MFVLLMAAALPHKIPTVSRDSSYGFRNFHHHFLNIIACRTTPVKETRAVIVMDVEADI
jgi:hypothetical protein